jgi:hypothetical protein
VVGRPHEADLLGTEHDDVDARVQFGFAGRECVGHLDDHRRPGTVVHRALRDVVGVDVAGEQHLLVGVRAEFGVDVLARGLARLGLDGDGEPVALVPPCQPSAEFVRDPDRGNLTDE